MACGVCMLSNSRSCENGEASVCNTLLDAAAATVLLVCKRLQVRSPALFVNQVTALPVSWPSSSKFVRVGQLRFLVHPGVIILKRFPDFILRTGARGDVWANHSFQVASEAQQKTHFWMLSNVHLWYLVVN